MDRRGSSAIQPGTEVGRVFFRSVSTRSFASFVPFRSSASSADARAASSVPPGGRRHKRVDQRAPPGWLMGIKPCAHGM